MYHVFSIDGYAMWLFVDGYDKYICRSLLYHYYLDVKHITYIGEYSNLDILKIPDEFGLDGFSKDCYDQFIKEYGYDF
jgi:hypothetical protein